MNKYKTGDKIVLEITGVSRYGESYEIAHTSMWNKARLDRVAKPLSEYTEPLEADASRLVKENVRLLAENAELKEKLQEEHHELVWQDGYSQGVSNESEKWNENVKIIRDNAFEAGLIRGHEDAWKLATKIALDEMFGGYKVNELKEIFGLTHLPEIFRLTYSEAAAKVAEWEQKKEEICVGDMLLSNRTSNKCVVTYIGCELITVLWDDGSCSNKPKNYIRKGFKKIGHIDVASMLAQIGGEE